MYITVGLNNKLSEMSNKHLSVRFRLVCGLGGMFFTSPLINSVLNTNIFRFISDEYSQYERSLKTNMKNNYIK